MQRKNLTACTAAALLLSVLTACGGNASQPADQPAQGSTAAQTTAATAASADTAASATTTTSAAAAGSTGTPAESTSAPAEGSTTAAAETPAAGKIAFDYVFKGVTIPAGAEADAIISQLGTADSSFEAPSCAFTGVSYYYTYGGVQVVTYPDEHDQKLNRIYEVDLLDGTAQTNEGIHIGSTYDDLIAACGQPDRETPAYAMYETEGKAVQFFLEGNDITSIVYTVVLT
jgi:hypothetical protein